MSISYGGTHITQKFGAPNLRDIAVQSMRVVRFNGAGKIWWPVGMHTLLVADIVVERFGLRNLEAHALLHDAAEMAGIGDISRPMKTDSQRELEHEALDRIYDLLGLDLPDENQYNLIKEADRLACNAEGVLECGPRGYAQTQRGFKRDKISEGLLNTYLREFKPADALDPDGRWSIMFEKRARRAIRYVQGCAEAFSNEA